MTIDEILLAVQTAIITNIDGFTTNNCSTGDEAVFDYVQTNLPMQTKCCIIDYAGFSNLGKSEFSSNMIGYRVSVNGFFIILNQEDYRDALLEARKFVSDLIELASVDSTLGGSVLRLKIESGTAPLLYRRVNYNYILISVSASIIDNVS